MRRILITLGIYTVVIFGICVLISFVSGNVPAILAVNVSAYKFNRGLLIFLHALPAIFLSGYTIGGCIQWKLNGSNSDERFSQAMMSRFRVTMLIGLVVVLCVTICQEIFVPAIKKNQKQILRNPTELSKDVYLADFYLKQNKPALAYQYADMAYNIDPTNASAVQVYRLTHDEMEITLSSIISEQETSEDQIEKLVLPLSEADRGYTAKELMDKARACAAEKQWFNCHYWATLAVKASNETENIHSMAVETANEAWNRMSNPDDFNNEAEKEYYATKKAGYTALNYGDFLSAYYIFLGLSNESEENARDPDVVRYLALAKERLENEFFFIDETDDLENRNSVSDVYFSLKMKDDSTSVIFIDRMTSLKDDGGLVRYLTGFNVISFDKNGDFVYSMRVPFAKVVAAPVSALSKQEKQAMGIDKKWKFIPEVYLQSVDRNTEGIVSKPVYQFETTGLPFYLEQQLGLKWQKSMGHAELSEAEKQALMASNILLLPMQFDDFDCLGEVSAGPESMNLLSLNSFVSKAENFGYAAEIYNQSLTTRGTFPILMLIFVVFAGVVGWNYRIVSEKTMFRFGWILSFPILFVQIYFLYVFLTYLAKMLNFVIVGACGDMALFVGFILYAVVLFLVSLLFLSRKK